MLFHQTPDVVSLLECRGYSEVTEEKRDRTPACTLNQDPITQSEGPNRDTMLHFGGILGRNDSHYTLLEDNMKISVASAISEPSEYVRKAGWRRTSFRDKATLG